MTHIPSPRISDLARMKDRLTFLFVEHATIGRDDGALLFTDETASAAIPASTLAVLILGPGTRLTHAAVALCGESGCGIIWTGSDVSPVYANGMPISQSTGLLLKQAEIVSNERKRLAAAKRLYSLRFPGEDLTGITMQQLLGKEGTRMQRAYETEAKKHGQKWEGRKYRNDDTVNKALDTANHISYGICQTVISGLGCSPALGIVHNGRPLSFVYDIADIRKPQLTIPVAFEVAEETPVDIRAAVRAKMRERMRTMKYLEQTVKDIQAVLGVEELSDLEFQLWCGKTGFIPAGVSVQAQGIKLI